MIQKPSKPEHRVSVGGAIQTHASPEDTKRHNTERAEDHTTHLTERREDQARESHKVWLERGTLLAVTIYAFIAAWQGWLMRESVKSAQDNFIRDQRAWVSVVVPKTFILDKPTVDFNVQIVDSGKTVARKINGDFFATVLNKGEKVPYDQFGLGHPHNRLYVGAIYPTAPPLDATLQAVKYGPKVPEPIAGGPDLAREIMVDKTRFLVVLGRIDYCDAFHVKHWVKFCNGTGDALGLDVKDCIAYNEVDTNFTPSAECN